MYDICSCDNIIAPMVNANVKHNPNPNPNPDPILNPYPTLSPKLNHHPHSNFLLSEISSQEQYCRRSKCHITFVLFFLLCILMFFFLFGRYLIENMTKYRNDQCTVSYEQNSELFSVKSIGQGLKKKS